MISTGPALFQTLALVLSSLFFVYIVTIVVPYLRRKPRPPGDADRFDWHLFIPARDEEAVIGDTVTWLRTNFGSAHLWVVDDDSDDRTAEIVQELADHDDRVHLVRRRRPVARTGKGDALNAAFDAMDRWLNTGDSEPTIVRERTIVGVVDADGRLKSDCFDVCAADHLFGDPRIGAVQVGVRMMNRRERRPVPERSRIANFGARLLVNLQELEFQGPISAMQAYRRNVGTVAMGGNGQFSRLPALDGQRRDGEGPWRGALLEDFEIGVHLLLDGWRTEHTEDTWVEQEGLVSIRRFVTQRTRWSQGTMQCIKYLPDLWRSDKLTNLGALEVAYYLVQPWMNLLGSIIYAFPVLLYGLAVIAEPGAQWSFVTNDGGWTLGLLYLGFGMGVFILWGPIYRYRIEPRAGRLQSLGWGVAFFLYANTVYITAWRAVFRIIRGRNGWAKTRRNADAAIDAPIALDH